MQPLGYLADVTQQSRHAQLTLDQPQMSARRTLTGRQCKMPQSAMQFGCHGHGCMRLTARVYRWVLCGLRLWYDEPLHEPVGRDVSQGKCRHTCRIETNSTMWGFANVTGGLSMYLHFRHACRVSQLRVHYVHSPQQYSGISVQ